MSDAREYGEKAAEQLASRWLAAGVHLDADIVSTIRSAISLAYIDGGTEVARTLYADIRRNTIERKPAYSVMVDDSWADVDRPARRRPESLASEYGVANIVTGGRK